ncbi:MFS transporter, partial [Gordonia sp. 852002-50395_SCH5434458]
QPARRVGHMPRKDASSQLTAPLAWTVLILSVAQAVAVLIPLALFGGEPNDDGVDLLISPAGYAFAIWAVIYVLSAVTGYIFVRGLDSGTQYGKRLAVDLAIACGAAALWLIVSAASIDWLPSILLTVMALALLDAARIAALPVENPSSTTTLVRITIGIYAGWATAAVFVNWASDIARSGAADESSAGWQLVVLIVAALVAVTVTYLYGSALPALPITLAWALLAIAVNAWSDSTPIAVTAVVGIVAVALAYWASTRRTSVSEGALSRT